MRKSNEFFGILSLIIFIFLAYMLLFKLPIWISTKYPILKFQDNSFLQFSGYFLLVFGILIWLSSVILLRIVGKGTPHPIINPTKKVVSKGFYKVTRHPIYFSFFIIIVSLGLIQSNYFLLVLSTFFILIICSFIIPAEEKYLTNKFGTDYVIYAEQTPMFFPVYFLKIPIIERQIGLIWILFVIFISYFTIFVVSPNFSFQISNNITFNYLIAIILFIIGLTSLVSSIFLFATKGKGLKRIGPYRYVRNPMYVGIFLFYLSLSFYLNSASSIFFFPLIYLLAYYYVALVKEKKQALKYTDEFHKFKKEVGRFFPKFFK